MTANGLDMSLVRGRGGKDASNGGSSTAESEQV